MKRHLLTPLAVAATAAFALSACGGGGGEAAAPTDADVVAVGLDSLVWDQPTYSATAGEVKVALVNGGSINHTLLVVSADGKQLGEKLEVGGGQTDEGTFTLDAGEYTLFCNVPGHGNMKSVLTVT